MSKQWAARILLALVLSGVAFVAYAGSISGVFGFSKGSIILDGTLRGLGNVNDLSNGGHLVQTVLDATVTVTAVCVNQGGTAAPGRNPIQLAYAASVPLTVDKNGKADVHIEICDPGQNKASCNFSVPSPTSLISPTPKQAGCPNGNWTVIGFDPGTARWRSAVVTVTSDSIVALQQSYTCVDTGTSLSCTPV